MKNCIKILVFVAAALFLFSAGSLLVNAEDGNGTEQENKQYKTTVTLRYIDFSDRYDGGYTTYTIISSKPLYIYYLYTEEPAACMPQLYSGEIDDSISSGISSSGSFSVSGITYFPDGSTRMVNNFDLGALTYNGRIVKTIEASCPIFYSFDAMKNYILDGDESGWTNKPAPEPKYYFDENIETPRLSFIDGLKFYIDNASVDYGIEIEGRCYTVDDIELYKADLLWKYKYASVLKNDLSIWVSVSDNISSSGEHDLYIYGAASFSNLLQKYPIDNRTYYGGTNAVGNYFSGYSDALSTLKTVLLSTHGSLFNGTEIYIRFYYLDNMGNVHYGKWCHWFDEMANSAGSSGSQWDDKTNMFTENQSNIGLTPDDRQKLEDTGNSKGNDNDSMPKYNNTSSWDSKAGDEVWDIMNSMSKKLGDFPRLVQQVFLFLPDWLISLIAVGLGLVVLLRFLGR